MFDNDGRTLEDCIGRRQAHEFGVFLGLMTRIAAVLTVLLTGQMMTTATARAGDDAPGSPKFVYVESNDPAGNAIFGFARQKDGSLVPLPKSPYPAGGLGITPTFALGPFDSDQNVIINADHTRLFAVNGGSNTIAVFNIAGNGVLTPVPGSPFFSGGSNPVSVGLAGNTLCVVNQDQDPDHPGLFLPNYTSLSVAPSGKLTPIPNSTIYVDAGSSPSQALISPDNSLMFGAEFLGGLLRTLKIAPGGRLSPGVSLPLPPGEFADTGAPPNPLGLAVHPVLPLLYVDFVTISRIGVYRYNRSGGLKFLRSVPDSGKAPCWARVNKDGTRLYASNTADSSISVFDLGVDPTEPIEIQKVSLRTAGSCFQFTLDSSESFLYVVTQQAAPTQTVMANGLNVLKVAADGTLTEVPSSPTLLPAPNQVRPQGVAAL
jgi:6-phosphogluconolactonase (cycloisomerase 2 family)